MAADETTVELFATASGWGSLGELLAQNRTPARAIDIDVLDDGNAEAYWGRDERQDFSISLNRGRPALEALARVLEKWVRHFLAVDVTIEHERAIDDKHWVWHVGLDAEASGLLNDLYNEVDVDEERLGRLLCLFRLDFRNPADMRPAIAGRPVYLAMAMDRERRPPRKRFTSNGSFIFSAISRPLGPIFFQVFRTSISILSAGVFSIRSMNCV